MARKIDLLKHARIASPCPVAWSSMRGDERVRFCDQCKLNVYNIAELSRAEAEQLIIKTEGRLCARLHYRADGTVITRDCPVGLAALRKRLARVVGAMAAMIGLVVSAAAALGLRRSDSVPLAWMRPFERLTQWLEPPQLIMGGIVVLPMTPDVREYLEAHSAENDAGQCLPAGTARESGAADSAAAADSTSTKEPRP